MEKLYRLNQIVKNRNTGEPGLLPITAQTFYRGIREGRFPPARKLSPGVAVWFESDIKKILDDIS